MKECTSRCICDDTVCQFLYPAKSGMWALPYYLTYLHATGLVDEQHFLPPPYLLWGYSPAYGGLIPVVSGASSILSGDLKLAVSVGSDEHLGRAQSSCAVMCCCFGRSVAGLARAEFGPKPRGPPYPCSRDANTHND